MSGFPVTAYAVCNALGDCTDTVLRRLRAGASGLGPCPLPLPFPAMCGAMSEVLPEVPPTVRAFDSRQTRMLCLLLPEIAGPLARAREHWGPGRVGVVLGTSTAGMVETENAYSEWHRTGILPQNYDFYRKHQPEVLAFLVRSLAGILGPAATLSTACSSSAKVFGTARRWLRLGVCDAVLVGGIDTLCQVTLRGFHSLELLSPDPCRPFSSERTGLNLGEGGGLALLERSATAAVELVGVGETSDAHHMTAPHPEGQGAIAAMRQALEQAGRQPGEVDYINAHGTGTRLNDSAEGIAIAKVFGGQVPIASTKGYTGHMLGAAGITEAIFTVASVEQSWLPASLGSQPADAALGLRLLEKAVNQPVRLAMSNSFAFGGSNASVLFAGRSA